MTITTHKSARIPFHILVLSLALLSGLVACKSKESEQIRQQQSTGVSSADSIAAAVSAHTDSLVRATGGRSASDELQLPSVPEVGLHKPTQMTRKLPEEDEMDVRSPIQLKFIASSETSVRGVRLFIVGVDRDPNMTVVHAFVQNLWGRSTRVHPDAIAVKVPEDEMAGAKLLDDQTGKSHVAQPNLGAATMEVTRSIDWTLKPGERQTVVLTFPPLSPNSSSATLIIPGFATVTGVPLKGD